MAAALYAVNPGAPYFKLSEDGKVRKLLLDPEQKKAIRAVYTELASGKPLPKPHFGPPNVEEVKPDRAPDKNQDCSQWWMPGTMPQPIAF